MSGQPFPTVVSLTRKSGAALRACTSPFQFGTTAIIGVTPRGEARTALPPRSSLALYRWGLPAILFLGFCLRLVLIATPRAYQADEVFQYLEQAHRLVFGYGVIPWEYRFGIRSWLFPIALTGPMALGGWIAPASGAYLFLPKLSLVLLSLTAIGAAASLGRRISPAHGLMAALVVAGWSEFAYFATQALTDAVAVPLFLTAAALLYGRDTAGRLSLSGALVALAVLVRFQYAPAIGLFVVLTCRVDARRWAWGLLGAAIVLAISAAVDRLMGQTPFAWIIENYRQNIVNQRSHLWVDGPAYYFLKLVSTWKVWLVPIIILACVGARRYPTLMIMAIANIAMHTTIAHKEYRYILLSTAVIVILAAIGTVDAVRAGQRKWPRIPFLSIAALCWISASILTTRPHFVAYNWSLATPNLEAFSRLRREDNICGVAVRGVWWSHTGGYAYLHRPIPLYYPDLVPSSSPVIAASQAAYNAIVAPPNARFSGYQKQECFGVDARFSDQAVCIFHRAGGCDASKARDFTANRALLGSNR